MKKAPFTPYLIVPQINHWQNNKNRTRGDRTKLKLRLIGKITDRANKYTVKTMKRRK